MTAFEESLADFQQAQRDRIVIVVAAVIGIVASFVIGLGVPMGMLGHEWTHAMGGMRNPGLLIFFIGPFAVAMGLGYAVYGLVRLAHRRRPQSADFESSFELD
jgi:hypothetical protein